MQARIVRKEVSFHTSRAFMHFPAVPEGVDPTAEQLFVMCGADTAIRNILKKQYILAETEARQETLELDADASAPETLVPADDNVIPEDEADKAAAKLMLRLDESYLVNVPHMPQRLGRVSSQIVGKGLHCHTEPAPLAMQLQVLRKRKPHKQHFRIALVNGFGGAHCDCLLGMTAMRHVAATLQEHLPSFSVDVLYGPESRPGNAVLVNGEPYIERVLFQELNMADFSAYDAYFDVSGLILLPRYNELPAVDFMLWWFGLDPEAIPPEGKRNQVTLFWQDWNTVADLLRNLPSQGRKLVLFNAKASCRVRSIPEPEAENLLKKLLKAAPDLHFVIDQPLNVTHPRLSNLSAHITSVELFKALVAQVDGGVLVDSFGPHLADVTSTPTVMLASVLPKSFYPYYPYNTVLELAGIETLPAYRKVKDNSDDEWNSWKDAYTAAWKKLRPAAILSALRENMRKRAETSETPRIHMLSELPQPNCIIQRGGLSVPRRDLCPPLWLPTQLRMANLCARLLKLGSVAVLAGAGQSALPEMLARQCGSQGKVHIFEPRAIRAGLIAGDLCRRSLFNAVIHPEDLGDGNTATDADAPAERQVHVYTPWSEADPYQWGNVPHLLTIPVRTLDSFQLPFCHALLVQPPFTPLPLLRGAVETLRRCRPVLIFGPLSVAEAGLVSGWTKDENYQSWLKPLGENSLEQVLLLGVPEEENCRVEGFIKVEHKK